MHVSVGVPAWPLQSLKHRFLVPITGNLCVCGQQTPVLSGFVCWEIKVDKMLVGLLGGAPVNFPAESRNALRKCLQKCAPQTCWTGEDSE